jgi:hypothetical protein
MSNAVTSGCFGDQTFSKSLVDEAGETSALNNGMSGGARQTHFETQWDFASTVPDAEQPGLSVVASPDRGDGSRMSWVQMTDTPGGIDINFADVQGTTDPANFVDANVATGLDRGVPHTIKITMDFVDGPSNDVVQVYVDGVLKLTGTSWENYYRFDTEAQPEGGPRTVDSILFRTGGTAAPGTDGNGFLIDNLTLSSSTGPAACAFTVSGTTETLVADCTTDHTILVPNGFTLDGAGHTITAVDPAGGHFVGAVIQNGGVAANVTNVTVTAAGLADVCDGGVDRLRGILFDDAAGAITNVSVHGVRQGLSGCQEGNAIEARNFTSATVRAVTISNNVVSDYQKNGITVNGCVNGTLTGNSVTGDGPITYIAQNGIQIGFGGSALVRGNTVSGNYYTPASDIACGLLFFEAGGVRQQSNTLFANERNLCNFGRGGGNPASPN